jgi:thymidylate synthase (FAD)
MKLLINEGSFEILAQPMLMVESKDSGEAFHKIIKTAATTCYQSNATTTRDAKGFTSMLRKRGHWSMFDHVSVTVRFKNCSRGFTHELVRHRIAAYAQESTRYVDESKLLVIAPPHRNNTERIPIKRVPVYKDTWKDKEMSFSMLPKTMSFGEMVQAIECFYRSLKAAGWANEDARQILPIGTKSEIVMTADLTEWRHVFALRTQEPAHWEIRRVMGLLLEKFKEIFAPTFDDFQILGKDINGLNHYSIVKPVLKNGTNA